MPQCLQQYLRNFFCHDITTCNVANSEMFWVNTFVNFLFSFIGEKINKGLRRSIYFPCLKFSKHEIVWKQHATFLNRAKDDSKRWAVTKAFLALKGRTDNYLKYKLLSPVKTRVWYRLHESERENGLYHADNGRAHASYMLCSTTRKSTWSSLYNFVWNVLVT